MVVLGIEGTAWAASAATYDPETDRVTIVSDPYEPEQGGIHPREAAEHMRSAIPGVVADALDEVDAADASLDAVAFSQGPGLGPCLRTVGSAARALAATRDVPLVGVNHMVAHAEVGRLRSDLSDPICLNTSGANAHVLAYRNGCFRVLGETMDTGIGNAIDKFARHVGWSHPGGPKVEEAATGGEYVELPYVVKGMDFSFAGLTSAAIESVDDGAPVPDVCRSLQEHAFAMVTEVTERAMALAGTDELVLGGGVGQNARLQSMLGTMCENRDATLFVPEDRFLRDNAGMIAIVGAEMLAAGQTIPIEDSAVRPDFRPDQVDVTWRSEGSARPRREFGPIQGAEARVERVDGALRKRREARAYREPALDSRLRRQRTAVEARVTSLARRQGVTTPVIRDVDPPNAELHQQYVGTEDLAEAITTDRLEAVARHLATLHEAGLVHGDPTPRNVRIASAGPTAEESEGSQPDERVVLVDFGLGYHSHDPEDHAMDLHVLLASLGATGDPSRYRDAIESAYATTHSDETAVFGQLRAIEGRGRYVGPKD
jgi:N6-L-threonylcarbamoyladenine synthase/protein kinase Bud32